MTSISSPYVITYSTFKFSGRVSDAAYCVLFSFNSNFSLTLSNKLKRLYFPTTPHVINIKKTHFLICSLYIFINNNTNHLFRVHLSDKVYVVIFLVYLLLFCRWCCHNNISLRNTYQSRSNFPLLWSISWYKLQNIKVVLILLQLVGTN